MSVDLIFKKFISKNLAYLSLAILMNILVILKSYGEDGTITCALTVTNIVFSSYNPYDSIIEKANGTAKVVCKNTSSSKSMNYTVSFGTGGSNNQTARLLKNGTNSISYNLCKEAAFTNIYGDGNNSTVIISKNLTLATNGSSTDNYTIYGKIPVQPLSKPMTYTDTLVVTLWYNY